MVNDIQVFRNDIKKMSEEFKAVLPKEIPVDRFIRTTITAVQMNPELLDADKTSLLASTMKAAQDGLLCDGREAALVIFNKKDGNEWKKHVQYMPMVTGLLKKLRDSGEIQGAPQIEIVKENDEFDYELGDNPKLSHKPAKTNRGKVIGAYSIVRFKDGGISREYMDVHQIEGVRARSRAKDSGPWKSDYEEMCRKTVFRRHQKKLPTTPELIQVLTNDNETYNHDLIEGTSENSVITNIAAQIEAEKKGAEVAIEIPAKEAEVVALDPEDDTPAYLKR